MSDRAGALLLAALTCLCFSTSALARQSGPKFEIKRFEVTGNTLLPAAKVEQALAPFLGAGKDFADIQSAVDALEAAFKERGFGVVQVSIPQQDVVGGTVRLRVIEPRVGKVAIEGNLSFSETNIRRSFPAVQEGQPPNTEDIARNLQLANESPSKQTTLLLRAGASDEVVDVGIRVVDEKPWKVFATLDNTGTGSTGYYRSGFGYQISNLSGRDDTLTAQYITSPSHVSKVSIFGYGYKLPLYELNSSVEVIFGHSDVSSGAVGGLFNVSGSGNIGLARWNWILPRWGDTEQKLSFGLDYRAYTNQVQFQGQNVVPDITVHPLSLAYTGTRRGAESELTFYGSLAGNIPGGGKGDAAAFQSSRASATANYTVFRAGLNFLHRLGGDWQARASINGQYTGDALVSAEQYGIGGPDTVRGYPVREVASDSGYSSQLELYSPEFGPYLGFAENNRLRMLAFFDSGTVWRNHALPGERRHASLASAGLGTRWYYEKSMSLRLDVAQVLKAAPDRERGSVRGSIALVITY